MSHDSLVVLFRPGTGKQHSATGISVDKLERDNARMSAEEMLLEDLRIKNGHYTAVWQSGISGTQHWQGGMTAQEFDKVSHAQAEAGRRIHCISVDGDSLAAVWRDGSGQQEWHVGLPHDDFKKTDEKWAKQGLRIQAISVDGGNIACCWRPGTGEYAWIANTSRDKLTATNKAWRKHGLSMVKLAVDDSGLLNTGGEWTAVWAGPKTATEWGSILAFDLDSSSANAAKKGLRIVALGAWQAGIGPAVPPPTGGGGGRDGNGDGGGGGIEIDIGDDD